MPANDYLTIKYTPFRVAVILGHYERSVIHCSSQEDAVALRNEIGRIVSGKMIESDYVNWPHHPPSPSLELDM